MGNKGSLEWVPPVPHTVQSSGLSLHSVLLLLGGGEICRPLLCQHNGVPTGRGGSSAHEGHHLLGVSVHCCSTRHTLRLRRQEVTSGGFRLPWGTIYLLPIPLQQETHSLPSQTVSLSWSQANCSCSFHTPPLPKPEESPA